MTEFSQASHVITFRLSSGLLKMLDDKAHDASISRAAMLRRLIEEAGGNSNRP